MSNADAAQRWFDIQRGKTTRKNLSNHPVYGNDDKLYSYGPHFPLVENIGVIGKPIWLINGDTYSLTTNQHQSMTRELAGHGGESQVIIPFSALRSAYITNHKSIQFVDVRKEQWVFVEHSTRELADVPQHYRRWPTSLSEHITPDEDGVYHWRAQEHQLGEAVISAEVRDYGYANIVFHRRWFLSGFDDTAIGFNRAGGGYFFTELPHEVSSVEEARESLKPKEVKIWEEIGEPVLRQGDIFALKTGKATRDLIRCQKTSVRTLRGSGYYAEMVRMDAYLICGTDHHTVTELRIDLAGNQYGRGTLRHLNRDHKRIKLDGWHLLVRNVVPQGRSWSYFSGGGRVD